MMKLILMLLALSSFTVHAEMSEAQCENQAKGVFTLLQMVEDGSVPLNSSQLKNLQKAKDLYDAGEYCKARQIFLNLNQS